MVYYISHESGMKQERKLAGYRAQMMARAVENGVWVVASNAPANPEDNPGSHGQSRVIGTDGNVPREGSYYGEDVLVGTLEVKAGRLERPLSGVTGEGWKRGLEQ